MSLIARLVAGGIPAFFLMLFAFALNDLTTLYIPPLAILYGAVIFTLGFALLSMRLETWAEQRLIRQNAQAVQDWKDAGHICPDAVRDSVFKVSNTDKNCMGTAFMLTDGTIVSNRHVVDGAKAVELDSYQEFTAAKSAFCATLKPRLQVLHVADPLKGPDIAFIAGGGSYRANGMKGLPLAKEAPKPGDKLLIVGQHGRRDRFYQTVVTVDEVGIKGKLRPKKTLLGRYMWSVRFFFYRLGGGGVVASGTRFGEGYSYRGDCSFGNSGSPVVNTKGEVVGVNYAGHPYFIAACDCIGFGAGLSVLKTELDNLRNNPNPPSPPPTPPKVSTVKLYFEWEQRYGRW